MRKTSLYKLTFFWLNIAAIVTCLFFPKISLAFSVNCVNPPGKTMSFWWTDNNELITTGKWKLGCMNPGEKKYSYQDHEGKLGPQKNDSLTGTVKYDFQLGSLINKATDWVQENEGEDGKAIVTGAHWKKGKPPANGSSGILNEGSLPWEFHLLSELPDVEWRIPDLAPVTGGDPDRTIYTAVNLDVYLRENPLGFLNGDWSVGQTLDDLGLTITNGVIPGLQGIYWSTTPFIFDPDPSGNGYMPSGGAANYLNSDLYPEDIGAISEHPPEPATLFLLTLGGLFLRKKK
jgi:hypothetical protein